MFIYSILFLVALWAAQLQVEAGAIPVGVKLSGIFTDIVLVNLTAGQIVTILCGGEGQPTCESQNVSTAGIGPVQARWGDPRFEFSYSGLAFNASSDTFQQIELDTAFFLGTLYSINFPIQRPAQDVTMRISAEIRDMDGTNLGEFDTTFVFEIDETVNNVQNASECVYQPVLTSPCPDRVSWNPSDLEKAESFQVGNFNYTMFLRGFAPSPTELEPLLSDLITQEEDITQGFLVAIFEAFCTITECPGNFVLNETACECECPIVPCELPCCDNCTFINATCGNLCDPGMCMEGVCVSTDDPLNCTVLLDEIFEDIANNSLIDSNITDLPINNSNASYFLLYRECVIADCDPDIGECVLNVTALNNQTCNTSTLCIIDERCWNGTCIGEQDPGCVPVPPTRSSSDPGPIALLAPTGAAAIAILALGLAAAFQRLGAAGTPPAGGSPEMIGQVGENPLFQGATQGADNPAYTADPV